MSIPPLVCSTPPPPDQCEDDKDPDDFDIPYNLSQDDDDDDFGYGDFSSFNHYQSNTNAIKEETLYNNVEALNLTTVEQVIEEDSKQSTEGKETHNSLIGTNVLNEIKTKCEEDTNIEDLGLEISKESISSQEGEGDEQNEIENCINDSVKDLESVDNVNEINIINTPPSIDEETTIETTSTDHSDVDKDEENLHIPTLQPELEASDTNIPSDEECKNNINEEECVEPKKESNFDDDFGDFDDFQFAGSDSKPTAIIENCDNPWDNSETGNDDGFGDFTADFDAVEKETSPIQTDDSFVNIQEGVGNAKGDSVDDDDDFGEFDDFKSTTIDRETKDVTDESEMDEHIPVLNFHNSDSEHQIMESITKVLTSVFEVEISEPDSEYEGKLETMLSETWRHLRETDIRQPYIINWNNSLGQKTLLRALCIDSRNILFGPKWGGYNTPKYAVNLSAAPLQPQKPLTPSNASQSEPPTAEKPTAKPSGWTDPFTADGQEFTYAEALLLDLEHLMATLDQMAHNHSTLKISELLSHACNTETESVVEVTPTDLDVFEASISTKSDKIYSSTLNVQPLRQINLPDTHIFTPTDSETPRSKTIHYDSGPPILLPQTVLETKTEVSVNQHSTSTVDDKEDDYWEFQDFKSSSGNTSTSMTNTATFQPHEQPAEAKTENVIKPNGTFQTQVLLPIKMEPLMPTVNWPDPGEIKETFDDFSDFVSNSSWNEKPQSQISTPQAEDETIVEANVLDKITDKHKNIEVEKEPPKTKSIDDFDDDFDTFQSALPPKHITNEFNFNTVSGSTFNNIPSNSSEAPNFEHAFPKVSNVKSDVISVNNPTRPSEALTPTFSYTSNSTEFSTNKSSLGNQTSHHMLPASSIPTSSQNQQKTAQILQPLSLESYSQINWPNPGIDLQDLSRFNPVETLQSLKSDLSAGGPSKGASPVHTQKNAVNSQVTEDDIWGEFVSSKPKAQATLPKKQATFADDDEWTDFVSSPSVKPQNGLNTISFNVHTNSNIQKSSNNNKFPTKTNQMPLDIPTLNYITPKASGHNAYNDRHFQNL